MDKLNTVAFALSLFGGVYDLFTRRVPNWLTFSGILAGILVQVLLLGLSGLWAALGGTAVGFALFFPIFFFHYMGAGDVKLLMLVGAWTSFSFCWKVAVIAVIVGALYALLDVLLRGRLVAVFRALYRFLFTLFVPELAAEPLKIDKERKFSFGICIAIAVAVNVIMQHEGISL